jgi:predicted permease
MWGWFGGSPGSISGPTSFEKYRVLRDGTFYEDMAIVTSVGATTQTGDSVTDRQVTQVSPNFFQVLGAEPEIGRLFGPGTSDDVAVISYQEWMQALDARPIEGATIWIGGRSHAVVGVLQPTMSWPGSVIVPIPSGHEPQWLTPVVRTKKGLKPEALHAQLAGLAGRLTATYGQPDRVPFSYEFTPLAPQSVRLRKVHLAMGGAALAILLVACANLAGLMLARGATKQRELALRLALGSGRRALVRQLLTESAIVSLVGGTLGFLLALWAIDILIYRMPPYVSGLITQPHMNWRVVAFSLLAAGGTVLLFGLWPALRASDVSLSDPLKDSSATTTTRRPSRYNPLIIGEVAASLVLLMGGWLLGKATARLAQYDFGYDTSGLVSAFVGTYGRRAADSVQRGLDDVVQRVRSVPGVKGAAWFRRGVPEGYTILADVYDGTAGVVHTDKQRIVSEDFLRTLGIPVIQGRDFLPGDGEAGGAVIVDETLARELWGGAPAVGQRLKLGDPESDVPWLPVVGVARRAALDFSWDPDLARSHEVYVMMGHGAYGIGFVVARVEGNSSSTVLALRGAIRNARPSGAPLGPVRPWLRNFEDLVKARGFLAAVFGAFSAFATVLAAVGLSGVLSQTVGQRLREFGIRVALGAVPGDLVRLVARDAAVMVLAGVAIGAFLAMWGAQLLDAMLYDLPATDAGSLVAAEVVLLVAALAACVVPALRASRANPVEILRAM